MTKKDAMLKAGAKLFAERSYSSVGIRDIASEAGVNSAMISYYFGGKAGLLREIFMKFDRLFMRECTAAIEQAASQKDLTQRFVTGVLDNARENMDVYMVGLKELNHDSEELQDLRDDLSEKSSASFLSHVDRLGINVPDNPELRDLGFTATLGLIFSDLLIGGGVCAEDDALFEEYKQTVITILQTGMTGYWS